MAETQPAWEITSQMETVGQLDSGAFGEGVKVAFRTASGMAGTVFVPRDHYNAPAVRAAIAAKASTMDEVAALKG